MISLSAKYLKFDTLDIETIDTPSAHGNWTVISRYKLIRKPTKSFIRICEEEIGYHRIVEIENVWYLDAADEDLTYIIMKYF